MPPNFHNLLRIAFSSFVSTPCNFLQYYVALDKSSLPYSSKNRTSSLNNGGSVRSDHLLNHAPYSMLGPVAGRDRSPVVAWERRNWRIICALRPVTRANCSRAKSSLYVKQCLCIYSRCLITFELAGSRHPFSNPVETHLMSCSEGRCRQ